MIITNGANEQIERLKARAGIAGDVYLVREHLMESLVSHKRLFPDSQATTIQEAEQERIAYEEEQDAIREAERLAAQQEAEAQAQPEEEQPNENEGE